MRPEASTRLIVPSAFCTPLEWCSMPRAWNRKLVLRRAPPSPPPARIDALRHAGDLGGLRERPLPDSTRPPASKPTVCASMKSWSSQSCSIIRCSTPANSAASRPGLTGRIQIAGARHRRDARVLDDDLRALLARLPDVVGRDRRALGDVRARRPRSPRLPTCRTTDWSVRSMPNAFLLAAPALTMHSRPL